MRQDPALPGHAGPTLFAIAAAIALALLLSLIHI